MYRKFRYKGAAVFAIILHVSNPDLFHRALIPADPSSVGSSWASGDPG